MGIDEAALVTRQEDGSLRLLNGLTETTRGEVNFATEALGLVISEELLEHGSASNRTLDSMAHGVVFDDTV